jgi:Ser/Thr protein kinase RdoA (MazF antagonist)
MVGARRNWNAWITEDGGQPLSDRFAFPALEQAISSLAQLQKTSVNHIDEFLDTGCVNRTIPVLEAHLGELTAYLEEAMERQTSSKVKPLSKHRLRELECILRDACCRVQHLGIPDTLVHSDLNAGNILFDGTRNVFIDWAGAYIGHPFVSFQHLCLHLPQDLHLDPNHLLQVKDLYKRSWRDWFTESRLDQAFALIPILAITYYLYGRGDWLDTPWNGCSRIHGYRRSLARHIDFAAHAPELLEALSQ